MHFKFILTRYSALRHKKKSKTVIGDKWSQRTNGHRTNGDRGQMVTVIGTHGHRGQMAFGHLVNNVLLLGNIEARGNIFVSI